MNYALAHRVYLIFELKQAPPGGPSRKGMDGEPTEGEVKANHCQAFVFFVQHFVFVVVKERNTV